MLIILLAFIVLLITINVIYFFILGKIILLCASTLCEPENHVDLCVLIVNIVFQAIKL